MVPKLRSNKGEELLPLNLDIEAQARRNNALREARLRKARFENNPPSSPMTSSSSFTEQGVITMVNIDDREGSSMAN
ncbi:UNVERIFIED_CONTAM: hypothetical protein ITH36_25565, partial [Salmonella enterica subsp. enterica serovar Weltevreden]